MNLDIRDFDSVEEAIEYLRDKEGDLDELRVGLVESEDPPTREFPDSEPERHSPDIPVDHERMHRSRPHQALWLLNKYGDGGYLSNAALEELSEDPTFTDSRPSPAANAIFRVGYAERQKDGHRVYHRITEDGKKALNKIGRVATEPSPRRVLNGSNALDGDW